MAEWGFLLGILGGELRLPRGKWQTDTRERGELTWG